MRKIGVTLSFFSALALGLTLSAGDGCLFPGECIYWATNGHTACGNLAPVESMTSRGPVMIETPAGTAPSGCACTTKEEKALLETDPSHSDLDAPYAEIEASARQSCKELAQQLGADPAPCDVATLDKATVVAALQPSEACEYIYDSNDEENCPIPGADDDAGSDEGDEGDDTGGPPSIPDLPVGAP